MKRLFSLLIVLVGISLSSGAQDLHFSQWYTSPLSVNPALAGNFNGDYRVGLNARNQWAAVTVPYQTMSIYGDMALLEDALGNNNWIGTGLSLFMDRAGDGVLRTIKAHGSIAFHKHVSKQFFFSLGGGFGWVQKSIDFTRLTFSNQWDGIGFDGNISSQENFETNAFSYLDVNAGITFTYLFEESFRMTAGASMQHLNRPLESFYFTDNNQGNNQLGYRPVAHIGAEFYLDYFKIEPAVMYTATKKTNEIVAGTNFSINLSGSGFNSSGNSFYAGIWYRSTGSLIPLVGYQFDSYRVMLNYDLDVGSLSQFSNSRNGFEISFTHVGDLREPKTRLYCPKF